MLRSNGMISVPTTALILHCAPAMTTGKITLLMSAIFRPSLNFNKVVDGKTSISSDKSSARFALHFLKHFLPATVIVQADLDT